MFKRDWSLKALADSARRTFRMRRGLIITVGSSLAFAILVLGVILLSAGEKSDPLAEETRPRPSPSTTPQEVVLTPTPEPTPPVPPPGMVYVPGGTFTMGRDTEKCTPYETPAHTVTVGPFFIDVHEVTNEQYAEFLKVYANQPPPSTWTGRTYAPGTERMPVTGVSWQQANDYAEWKHKSLPIEEEWEFAARGPEGFTYPWGNEWDPKIMNAAKQVKTFEEVGSHLSNASPFGALDMVGNAWEWTASDLTVYPGNKSIQPPTPNTFKVLRGGNWGSDQNAATTTCRLGWRYQRVENYRGGDVYCDPYKGEHVRADGTCDNSSAGFRCVIRIPQAGAR